MSDMEFNLKVVLDGLRVICASHEERLVLLNGSRSAIDENFDSVVLDYLNGAVEAGLVPAETAVCIESLFKDADEFLSHLTWKQEDGLMKARPAKVREWQEKAAVYIEQIEAHSQQLQRRLN